VSPVVGVMLMLVVTIIIAAVVSGMAGGLASTTKTAPQLTMDVTIKDTGSADGSSYVLFDVKSVSEPIPTKNLKITTMWALSNGTIGGTTLSTSNASFVGFGAGVTGDQVTSGSYNVSQYFGNVTLIPGTTMKAADNAGLTVVLGKNWTALRTGDLVEVKITHIPSGKTIFSKSVGVA